MISMLIMVAGIIVGIFLFFVMIGNSMIGKRNRIEATESNIDVYLQERLDKISGLLEVFERSIESENELQTSIAKMRSNYHEAVKSDNIVNKDAMVSTLVRDFNATRENYPNLVGLNDSREVMNAIQASEKSLVSARRTYNRNVKDYRNACEMFPTSIVAKRKGFFTDDYDLFEAEARAKGPRQSMYTNHFENKFKVKEEEVSKEDAQ